MLLRPPILRCLLLSWSVAIAAHAESIGCNRAREVVSEVEELLRSPSPDHSLILRKLQSARDICPSLGAAWKYSYCSALALDHPRAEFFKTQAVFNGAKDLACGGPGSPEPPEPSLPQTVRHKYALLIGIGTFQDPAIRRLRFAAKDARDLRDVLVDPDYGRFAPEDVHVLVDADATRARILDELQWLSLSAQPEDMVVIFVSSHGSPNLKEGEAGLGGLGHVVTYDTAVERIYVNAIEFQDFATKVAHIRARRKVTFLDTCYSGQIGIGQKGMDIAVGVDDRAAKLFLSGHGDFLISSSRASERSWESDRLENGFFAYYLRRAIAKGPEPPTIRQIFDEIASEVPRAVANEKKAPQNPQLWPAISSGDLRIGVATTP